MIELMRNNACAREIMLMMDRDDAGCWKERNRKKEDAGRHLESNTVAVDRKRPMKKG
jgi:hypothetical protein